VLKRTTHLTAQVSERPEKVQVVSAAGQEDKPPRRPQRQKTQPKSEVTRRKKAKE